MFAHETEEKFADILDELGVVWEYEPMIFVLKEQDGIIQRAFRPDFYLPEYDLFIEISTCSNRSRKRRKVQAALEKYPEARIILLLSDKLNQIFTDFSYLWVTE